MRKVCGLLPLFTLAAAGAFAQSLQIDKIEKQSVAQAKKEVGFSALLEGTVADPSLEVFVFVYQPGLKGWTAFPATTDYKPEGSARYRWRAICHFGQLDGKGVGDIHQVRAMAFDHRTASKGLPEEARAAAIAADKTEMIVLKRIK